MRRPVLPVPPLTRTFLAIAGLLVGAGHPAFAAQDPAEYLLEAPAAGGLLPLGPLLLHDAIMRRGAPAAHVGAGRIRGGATMYPITV